MYLLYLFKELCVLEIMLQLGAKDNPELVIAKE